MSRIELSIEEAVALTKMIKLGGGELTIDETSRLGLAGSFVLLVNTLQDAGYRIARPLREVSSVG